MTEAVDTLLQEADAELQRQGWRVARDVVHVGESPVLVAESVAAFLAVVANEAWTDLERSMRLAQAELADLVSSHDRSGRRWDLFVVGLLPERPTESETLQIDQLEDNTLMARKVIYWPGRQELAAVSADRAGGRGAPWLRPFMAFHLEPVVHVSDPLALMHERLLARSFDTATVERAIDSFRERGEVELA